MSGFVLCYIKCTQIINYLNYAKHITLYIPILITLLEDTWNISIQTNFVRHDKIKLISMHRNLC